MLRIALGRIVRGAGVGIATAGDCRDDSTRAFDHPHDAVEAAPDERVRHGVRLGQADRASSRRRILPLDRAIVPLRLRRFVAFALLATYGALELRGRHQSDVEEDLAEPSRVLLGRE